METLHSSIDIGSNTVQLWIADNSNGHWQTIVKQTRVSRLSGKFDGNIRPEAISRTLKVLEDYFSLIHENGVKNIRATCTGVTRKAENTKEFLDQVEKNTGFRPVVISGETEAKLTAKGAVLLTGLDKTPFVLFDIGGYSTEIMWVSDGEPTYVSSLDFGAVFLTEKFLDDVPSDQQLKELTEYVEKDIKKESELLKSSGISPKFLVGTAGTPTTTAAMVQGLEKYDSKKVEGFILTAEKIMGLLGNIRVIPSEKRIEMYPSLQRGREDVLVAGLIICRLISKCFGIDKIMVTEGGILEGLLVSESF